MAREGMWVNLKHDAHVFLMLLILSCVLVSIASEDEVVRVAIGLESDSGRFVRL